MIEALKEAVPFLANVDFAAYLTIALAVVGAASAIATVTSNKTDDKYVGYLSKAINWLALNFGEAKNAEAVKEAEKKAE